MTLTEIEYGALASSAVLNSNFQYLQDKITELSALITTETSSYSASVATLNKNITDLINCKESFVPTGTIIALQSEEIPLGYLLCDGSEIKISEYEDLYNIIGTTFGQTDSTTFSLPDLIGKTLFGKKSDNTLGEELEAGLPNITGSGIWSKEQSVSGAIYTSWTNNFSGTTEGGTGRYNEFDASRSNSIYGKSTTVQPPAIVTNFVIKY